MTVKIDTTARIEKIRMQPQGAFPAGDPESGYGWLYFVTGSANGGMYFENDAGMRIGPFITGSAASQSSGIPANGWISDANTWSYLSATVISVNANITGSVGVGNRIQITQTTPKYFIATNISITGSTTYLNVYGGTDYTLANAAITSPYYSPIKAPFGFPLDPTKWTVQTKDTSSRTQSSPAENTWYNLGSISIAIPLGAWYVNYSVLPQIARSSGTGAYLWTTLSTANNSESDSEFSATGYTSADQYIIIYRNRAKTLVLAAATTYYLNTKVTSGANYATLYNNNDIVPLLINAICAYL